MLQLESFVTIVDDSEFDRYSMSRILTRAGFSVKEFPNAELFLANFNSNATGCLVVDLRMPGVDGVALQKRLSNSHAFIPVILVSGVATIPIATEAMRLGAIDVLEKPIDPARFCGLVHHGIELSEHTFHRRQLEATIKRELTMLTPKEREVLPYVCCGYSLKEIAKQFGFGFATAARHQSRILAKLNSGSPMQLLKKMQTANVLIEC